MSANKQPYSSGHGMLLDLTPMIRFTATAVIAVLAVTACWQPVEQPVANTRPYDSPFGDNVQLFDPDMDMSSARTAMRCCSSPATTIST